MTYHGSGESRFDVPLQWFAEDDEETGENEETDKKSADVEKLMSRLEALESERENQKKNEAGLQRTITDLKHKLEEKERESETAEERLERKLREFDQKEREYEQRQRTYEVTLSKRDVMEELGIPKKFESRIYGNTPEEIRKDAEEFARIYAEDMKTGVERGINEKLAASGAAPKTGEQPTRAKTLETKEDGMKASKDDLKAYFETVFKE